ncbi:MAG: hypothetical protein PSV40_15725 [Polaromonas sp.]|uniref:hypothetical protein n=1 Tax=Polaromonas sp. TaxID=1869339 RepID=UPI002489F4EF|nr:hypothetical protein [Polaromonas sp.]MDI1270537.1 hypothetical protein [Polaromonas sp.]
MKKSTVDTFPFLTLSTKKRPRLHTAVLLNPVEVNVAFKDYPSEARHKLKGLWMLVGAVNEEMYSAFKANAGIDIAAQFSAFPTPAGAAYGVVTCQVGPHQHRFVLPMFNQKVVELLASATKESLNIYLESAGELREGMLYDCRLTLKQFMPARAMSRALDHRKQKDFVREFPSVISEMLTLDLMPSLNSEEVCGVDVSVLMPQD